MTLFSRKCKNKNKVILEGKHSKNNTNKNKLNFLNPSKAHFIYTLTLVIYIFKQFNTHYIHFYIT